MGKLEMRPGLAGGRVRKKGNVMRLGVKTTGRALA
jgi:hypothetical protein